MVVIAATHASTRTRRCWCQASTGRRARRARRARPGLCWLTRVRCGRSSCRPTGELTPTPRRPGPGSGRPARRSPSHDSQAAERPAESCCRARRRGGPPLGAGQPAPRPPSRTGHPPHKAMEPAKPVPGRPARAGGAEPGGWRLTGLEVAHAALWRTAGPRDHGDRCRERSGISKPTPPTSGTPAGHQLPDR
jgi:hypothetical protein